MITDVSIDNSPRKVLNSIAFLYFDKEVNELQPKDLRGAIAGLYPEEVLLHQHLDDSSVKYKYPLIQYKFIEGNCLLLGIREGAKLICDLNLVGKIIMLASDQFKIMKKDSSIEEASFGLGKSDCFS